MTQKRQDAATGGQHTLVHFTPLRYPGGKGKLAPFVKNLLEENDLVDGEYVEPYAGGAGVALELLLHEYVSHIHINDICRPIYSFWKSVLDQTEELMRLIRNTRLTVRNWDKQKAILTNPDKHDDLTLGYAMFFLNRTNRSGILNGGIIGGRDQSGPWKIDARFNTSELIHRIESIAKLRRRISLSMEDAHSYLIQKIKLLPAKTLIYLDPPYYLKGKALYLNFYSHQDHENIAKFVTGQIKKQRWIVSYDNAPAIREMYQASPSIVYGLRYSARESREGSEVMFFCDRLQIPSMTNSMRPLEAA